MIPVDQVRTGSPKGQCTEAAVASVLEVPLDRVPGLWDPEGEDPRPIRRWVQFLGFIISQGYQFVRFNLEAPIPVEDLDFEALGLGHVDRFFVRGHHLLGGENPDGVGHMVVARAGVVVHDPNPSRQGLATVEEVIVFIPLDAVGDDEIHWLMRDYCRVDGAWKLTMVE
jgi:hypothetical protein